MSDFREIRRPFKDISGQRFHMLLALEPHGVKHRDIHYWFRCDCGIEKVISAKYVKSGTQVSCGCYARMRSTTHGLVGTPEYKAWRAMLGRCFNKNDRNYPSYGGRGITVCQEWMDDVQRFFKDMGKRPSQTHSIDRIDNDGNYTPDNCRWATKKEQRANQRQHALKNLLVYQGRAQTRKAWAREIGIPSTTICSRIRRGWPLEKVMAP